ncbi:MAG: TatD family hydrolase [Gammaproteobacteria bacterium]|nr:TatD family hydrolase [Gammaproteobacteria bacterium]
MFEAASPDKSPPLIDIGANLGHESFEQDLEFVMQRARNIGIVHMIVTGTSLPATLRALAIVERHPDYLSLTAGVHPHEASTCSTEVLTQIRELAGMEKVVALGETGLDFNRDYSPRPIQEEAFQQQLQLACELNKPVFLHQRDAHSRFLPILKGFRDQLVHGGVVHCFTGEKAELYDYLDLDMYIGITGWVCDERRGQHLLEMLSDIPPNRLLLETDAPYLLPRSLRPRPKSRRNEPFYLSEVLHTVAAATGRSAIDVAHTSTANAQRLFRLKVDQS